MSTENPILSDLELTLRRNMLRYHVGHDITCPSCSVILDVRRAVELDFLRGTEILRSAILCASCFDTSDDPSLPDGVTLQINDGRILFPPPAPRKPSARKPRKPEPVPGTAGPRAAPIRCSAGGTVRTIGRAGGVAGHGRDS